MNIFTSKTRLYRDQKPPLGSQINWGHPLSNGLVGAWLMNEGGGNSIKNLANPKHNGVIGPGSWGLDRYGRNIDFTASTSSQVEFGVSNILAGAKKCSFHFLLFYKTAQTGRIISKWGSTGGSSDYLINTTATNALQFALTDGVNYLITHSNVVLSAGNWYHIVVVWNGGTSVLFYFNGKPVGTTIDTSNSISSIPFGGANLEFGWEDWESAASAVMKLGFVNFFKDKALTPSESASLYEAPYQFIQPARSRFYLVSAGVPPVEEETVGYMRYGKYW